MRDYIDLKEGTTKEQLNELCYEFTDRVTEVIGQMNVSPYVGVNCMFALIFAEIAAEHKEPAKVRKMFITMVEAYIQLMPEKEIDD